MLHGHQDESSRRMVGAAVDPLRAAFIESCLSCPYLNKCVRGHPA